MIYYRIESEDSMLDSYLDEIQTNLPLDFLGLRIGAILPKDELFPERQITRISSPQINYDSDDSLSQSLKQLTSDKLKFSSKNSKYGIRKRFAAHG